MKSESEQLKNEPQRPKRKVSRVALVLTFIVGICLIAMNLRGVPDEERLKNVSRYVARANPGIKIVGQPCLYQHGWPAKWAESESTAVYKPKVKAAQGALYIDSPDFADGWPGRVELTSVSFQGLAINLAIILFALVIVFLVFQFRRRKARGINFSLFEIGVLVAGVCTLLAWYQSHVELYELEEIATSRIYVSDKDTYSFRRWCAPKWLRCLVGEKGRTRVFRHIDRIRVNDDSNTGAEMASEYGQFRYLRDLNVTATPIAPEVLESLSKLQHIERVTVSQGRARGSRNKSVLQLRNYFPDVTDLGERISASK